MLCQGQLTLFQDVDGTDASRLQQPIGIMFRIDAEHQHQRREGRLHHPCCGASVSLPRDRFWDIQVSKIDSPTRQPLLPRPSCVRAASPHLRKLGAGYAALPQMTGRDFSYAYFISPLRYRTPDKQCGPGRYRGLTAFASLSMAVSEGIPTLAIGDTDDVDAIADLPEQCRHFFTHVTPPELCASTD